MRIDAEQLSGDNSQKLGSLSYYYLTFLTFLTIRTAAPGYKEMLLEQECILLSEPSDMSESPLLANYAGFRRTVFGQ